MANKITTKELKKIIPLLDDSFVFKVIDEGVLITGITDTTEASPIEPAEVVEKGIQPISTLVQETNAIKVPPQILEWLGNSSITYAKCKEFVDIASKYSGPIKGNYDNIRKWCVKQGAVLNSALCSQAVKKKVSYDLVNNMENNLIALNL